MDNSIHNDEQIVQRQVIKKYNGARPWQVAVLMLMSAAVAAMVLFCGSARRKRSISADRRRSKIRKSTCLEAFSL